ncbi:MAG TPA: MarR family winged helix-turn-helix transcriptional regulator [Lachnospiraceae bacterium]|nr:MarR family winged helix-turn-helix transcriptional regulator [Lachnospiraceae bacterium]
MQEDISDSIRKYYDDWFEINKIYDAWAKKHRIPEKTLFVLIEIITSKVPCTQTLICENKLYSKQTVSQILNGLEDQGLLRRIVRLDDKRNKTIVLTEKGEHYALSLFHEMRDAEIKAFMLLTPKERKTVNDGFHLLSRALSKTF